MTRCDSGSGARAGTGPRLTFSQLTSGEPSEGPMESILLQVEPTAHGLRFVGEVDASTVGLMTTALDSAVESGGDVDVDLSGLSFIDIAGVTALVQVAARLGERRTLVVRNPPRTMHRILSLGWRDKPNANLKVVEP